MVTTTHDPTLVWYARPAVKPPLLRVADKRPHRPTHEGYLCVDSETGPTLLRTFLTPSLPATILSPDAACRENDCSGYTAISNCDGHNCSVTLRHCKRRSGDLRLPAVLRRGMLYTRPLIRPTADQRMGCRPPPSLPGCVDCKEVTHETPPTCPDCSPPVPVCQTTSHCPCCSSSIPVCQATSDSPAPAEVPPDPLSAEVPPTLFLLILILIPRPPLALLRLALRMPRRENLLLHQPFTR